MHREIYVLRIGHRPARDKRITTHVALIARAFGAKGIFISGLKDEKIEGTVKKVVREWGGSFTIKTGVNWKEIVMQWKKEGGEIIHLTMYGLPLPDLTEKVKRSSRKKLVIVGGEKVPGEVFKLADYNISVTLQPHSECGSLAVFLDRFFEGRELKMEFENAKIRVVPQEKGKKIAKSF